MAYFPDKLVYFDYLYIPLGETEKENLRKYLNVMIVFLVSGLWHGADWTYVIWGRYQWALYGDRGSDGISKKGSAACGEKSVVPDFCRHTDFALVDFFVAVFLRASSLDDVVGCSDRSRRFRVSTDCLGQFCGNGAIPFAGAVTLALLLMWQVDRLFTGRKCRNACAFTGLVCALSGIWRSFAVHSAVWRLWI